MGGAAGMVLAGEFFGFYSQEEALKVIDFNAIGLLFGMMIIVEILRQTGFFRYLAIKGVKFSRGSPWKILVFLGLVTAFLSMLIDNMTTLLIIGPVTILVAEILGISPFPLLLGETLLSNIGGIGTLIGDPPNILIGSRAGFSFNDFIIHLFPLAVISTFFTLGVLGLIFWKFLHRKPKKIEQIFTLREEEVLRDRKSLGKCLFALAGVVVLFVLEPVFGLKPAFVAFLGASLVLLLVRPKLKEVLDRVEWSMLIFFGSLFVLVGGVEKSGVLEFFARGIVGLSGESLFLSTLLIVVFSVLLSGVIDNIPYTATMIPVVLLIAQKGINPEPLWWGLALGAGIGGNLTPVGSAAGVIALSLSEKTRHPITFLNWLRTGTLVTILTTFLALFFVWLFFSHFL